jgi:DNA invertase Pin-like site-specific DNA recombinase
MNGSSKILPAHRQRQAVVYLRQSTPKQVLKNCESAINQRALRDRLLELGWRKDQIVLIDEDQARSAKQVAGRDGFQRLVADVSLRKVGLIIGTEVSRLSRNCADWHRLLELCGLFDTLIADAEGGVPIATEKKTTIFNGSFVQQAGGAAVSGSGSILPRPRSGICRTD